MTSWRALAETVHIAALGLWFGVLTAAAGAAAVLFPTIKGLDARLPGYEASPAENFRILGGMVAQQVFLMADVVMFGCCLAAIATLGVLLGVYRIPAGRPATIVRVASLALALAAFASLLFIVTPSLNSASRLHWAALKAGDAAAIARHRAAVDQLHPIARNLMAGMALTVLTAFVAAVRSAVVPWASSKAA